MTDSPRPPFIRYSDGSVSEGKSVPPDPRVLDRLHDMEMSFVRVDHQSRLQFGDFEVVIEGPFCLTAPDGTEHSLDPGLRASLGPLLDLYPGVLRTGTVDAAASLSLRFESEATIRVPSGGNYESWQVNGPGGFLVVCEIDGGGLSVWGTGEA